MLLLSAGPELVRECRSRGLRVFLDLKWHDIPNTVAEAARAAARLGVELATVHGLGGREAVKAAVQASGSMRIAAVTVLTSHSVESYGEAVGRSAPSLSAEVSRLARLALDAGAGAIVTSPQEIAIVKGVAGPDRWIVVPGIRPAGADHGDQRRTAEPHAAAAAGATHLVVGRPITGARDPRAVYQDICAAIA
jgi:orotidine-5'-phosphate decarboxylase